MTAVTCTCGIQIGQRVEAGVIAERALDHQRLGRIDVALDHELRLGRHLEVAGHRLRQLHRLAPQEAGEEELVDRRAAAARAPEYIDGGSAPSAMHTGIRSPRSAISRQCAAPTLCRCQCMASVSRPSTCTRYMPTLRMPRFGSRVITIGSVM